MKKILFAFMALMGVLVFTGCSNDDQLGVDTYRNYEDNFVQTFGKVNPNQDFNSLRAVTMDVSVANTQGNYTLRVFSAMPNTKGAKLLGKFENLNAGQVSTVRVDAHKAAKNIYCMVDDGLNNRTKTVAIPSAGKAAVKFDGIANARKASTRAGGDVVDIQIDDEVFDPNSATIAFEDLGASDDFDFNDAVIKVEYVTGTGRLKVTLMAVGAGLPLKLYCAYLPQQPLVSVRSITDDFDLVPIFDGRELHEVMGYDVNTMINTNWKDGKDNVEFVSCEIDAPNYLSLSDDGFPFILEVDGKSGDQYRITNNGAGAIPQVMVISGFEDEEGDDEPLLQVATRALGDNPELFSYMWRWPKERVPIQQAYPNINTWIEDNPDDFSFMVDGVVEDNLYDGYNPFAAYEDEGDIELQAVDLGLTSGTLWANMNVGASAPELPGGYYAWGETVEKDVYSWGTYLYDGENGNPYFYDFGDIRGTEYDVATTIMGDDWVMPTLEQFQELYDECEIVYATRKGLPGYKFTGPNGNSIFIPLAGYYSDDDFWGFGFYSYYWTSTTGISDNHHYTNSIDLEDGTPSLDYPFYGQSVRAVIKQSQTPAGPVAVDLGLPSGTKWANMNVGANAPEDFGGYYAWGETEEKDWYDESTYAYYQDDDYVNIGDDIAGTEYDVAHVKWGGDWVMPTKEQQDELRDNCTYEWTTVNDVNGYKFIGPNGNSIFLPASGYRWDGNLSYAGYLGYYLSSTQSPWYSDGAYGLYLDSGYVVYFLNSRIEGQSVRPVICGE